MLARTLKMAFWVSFDHLGKLVLANLLTMLAALAPLSAVFALGRDLDGPVFLALLAGAAVAGVLLAAAGLAGMTAMLRVLIETRDGSLALFFDGLRRHGLQSALLALAALFAAACLAVSAWYYTARFGAAHPVLGYGLGAMALWGGALLGLALLALTPALVFRSAGMAAAVKLAVLLVLANPLFYAGVAAHALLLAALALLTPPVLMLFSLAPLAALTASAYEMLDRKYARARGGGEKIDFDDENDDYLNRGLRDLIFPWKS